MRKEGKCKQLRVSHQGLRQQDSKVAVWACLRKLPKGGVKDEERESQGEAPCLHFKGWPCTRGGAKRQEAG